MRSNAGIGTGWHWLALALVGTDWHWLALVGIGIGWHWHWLALALVGIGIGWHRGHGLSAVDWQHFCNLMIVESWQGLQELSHNGGM